MNKQISFLGKCIRAISYVCFVYLRTFGGVFYDAMDRLVQEVEDAEEMRRRGTVLKQKPKKGFLARVFQI